MHVVITGAGRGIGAELAALYTASGARVTGTTRAELDVADPASVAAFAETQQDPVDLLVCNAGVLLDGAEQLDTGYPADMWAQTFAVNVTGVFQTVQTLLPNLRSAQDAKIAIIGSQMGSSTRAKGSSMIYRVSKAAVLNLGFCLSNELRPEGIAVGIYHPGWVRTDMGGQEADISVEEAVHGLKARFEALDIATTGCFETWEGRAHPI